MKGRINMVNPVAFAAPAALRGKCSTALNARLCPRMDRTVGRSFASRSRVRMVADSELSDDDAAAELIVDIGGFEEDEGLQVVDVLGADYDIVTPKTKKVRKRTGGLVGEIDTEPEENGASDADSQPPIHEDSTAASVRTAVRAADTRKGMDIVALRIAKLTYIASFVVIATGNNVPQLRAISNLVEEELFKEHGLTPKRCDGSPNSGWMLLDCKLIGGYLPCTISSRLPFVTLTLISLISFPASFPRIPDGDLLINVFLSEQREQYNLEGLWRKAEVLEISDCITGPEAEIAGTDGAGSVNTLDDWLS